MYVCVCTNARSCLNMFPLVLPNLFLRQWLLLNLEFIDLTRDPGQWAPRIPLFQPPQFEDYRWRSLSLPFYIDPQDLNSGKHFTDKSILPRFLKGQLEPGLAYFHFSGVLATEDSLSSLLWTTAHSLLQGLEYNPSSWLCILRVPRWLCLPLNANVSSKYFLIFRKGKIGNIQNQKGII